MKVIPLALNLGKTDNPIMKIYRKLKAILRDWLFKDHHWVTRGQVQRAICEIRWEYRDYPLAQKVLDQLSETID
jgi:hypothetical protein